MQIVPSLGRPIIPAEWAGHVLIQMPTFEELNFGPDWDPAFIDPRKDLEYSDKWSRTVFFLNEMGKEFDRL